MSTEKKVIELSGGKKATIGSLNGKNVLESMKLVGNESEKMIFGLIAQCVTIDGKSLVIEDVEQMDGFDVLKLMGEFSGNF